MCKVAICINVASRTMELVLIANANAQTSSRDYPAGASNNLCSCLSFVIGPDRHIYCWAAHGHISICAISQLRFSKTNDRCTKSPVNGFRFYFITVNHVIQPSSSSSSTFGDCPYVCVRAIAHSATEHKLKWTANLWRSVADHSCRCQFRFVYQIVWRGSALRMWWWL